MTLALFGATAPEISIDDAEGHGADGARFELRLPRSSEHLSRRPSGWWDFCSVELGILVRLSGWRVIRGTWCRGSFEIRDFERLGQPEGLVFRPVCHSFFGTRIR
jgi:hypothetical protein